jgi:hypothetical protein
MKRVALIVVVVAVTGVAVVVWARSGVIAVAGNGGTATDLDGVRAAWRKDLAAVEAVAGFARADGADGADGADADAGPVLNPRVPWAVGPDTVHGLTLPKSLGEKDHWLELIDDAEVAAVDTSLLQGLSRFSRWNVFTPLPNDVAPATSLLNAPQPAWRQLWLLGRAHLVKALSPAAAPDAFASAALDVEALARLSSSSHLIGALILSTLWKDVAAAHDKAAALGKAGNHTVIATVDQVEPLRRVLRASPVFYVFGTDDDRARLLQTRSLVLCPALTETQLQIDVLGPFVDDAVGASLATARATTSCAGSPPATAADLFCTLAEEPGRCAWQFTLMRLPLLRELVRGPVVNGARAMDLDCYAQSTAAAPTTTTTPTTTTPTTKGP